MSVTASSYSWATGVRDECTLCNAAFRAMSSVLHCARAGTQLYRREVSNCAAAIMNTKKNTAKANNSIADRRRITSRAYSTPQPRITLFAEKLSPETGSSCVRAVYVPENSTRYRCTEQYRVQVRKSVILADVPGEAQQNRSRRAASQKLSETRAYIVVNAVDILLVVRRRGFHRTSCSSVTRSLGFTPS